MSSRSASLQGRFAQAAPRYDQHSALFDLVGERLLERLDGLRFEPQRIVDLGCGTGRHSLALRERYPDAQITAIDCSPAMLTLAARRRGRWRPRFELLRGDIDALPLAQGSVDMVFANMSLQWSSKLTHLLMGLRRIMRPRGMVLMTLPGPDTLLELRQMGAELDLGQTTHAQELGDWLFNAGFQEPVLDTDWMHTRHGSLSSLHTELEALGIDCRLPEDAVVASAADQSITVRWEMLYATAWSPSPMRPI